MEEVVSTLPMLNRYCRDLPGDKNLFWAHPRPNQGLCRPERPLLAPELGEPKLGPA
jgi:hypothetical protein